MMKSEPEACSHGDNIINPKDEVTTDLSRVRSKYFKRTGNNYTLGSNISCLYSQELESRDPPKPSHRVRNIGKEIMLNANRCSWYQGMIEGASDTVVPTERRLHNKHAMTRSDSLFPRDETDMPPPIQNSHVARPNPIVPIPEQPTPKHSSQLTPHVSGAEKQFPAKSAPLAVNKDAVANANATPTEEAGGAVTTSSSTCTSALSETNASWLKRLEEQQIELIKQQLALSKQLDMQFRGQEDPVCAPVPAIVAEPELPKLPEPTEPSNATSIEAITISEEIPDKTSLAKSSAQTRYELPSHRRLKGAVAQRCAQRDEGSIKNLIWCQDTDEDDNNNKTVRKSLSSQRNAHENRMTDNVLMSREIPTMPRMRKSSCAVKAENSKNLKELLNHSYSSTSF